MASFGIILVNVLIALTGYILLVTIAGALQSRYAAYIGETLPRSLGLNEFHPLYHIDPMGLLLFVFLSVGWKRELPLSYSTQASFWQRTKIALIEPLVYILCSIITASIILAITHQGGLLVLQPVDGIRLLLPNHRPFVALVVYALEFFAAAGVSLSITSIFIWLLRSILASFTQNTLFGAADSFGLNRSTIIKFACFIAIFIALCIAIPYLYQPFYALVYATAYSIAHFFGSIS